MFTGIIEATGIVEEVLPQGTNLSFRISSPLAAELAIDQSLAHSGVCLTVEKIVGDSHWVTAVRETLEKTTLGQWTPGRKVNLERSLPLNGRLDGHIVQGHVDLRGRCLERIDRGGSWEYTIEFPPSQAGLLIEKGSVCLDGISLTVFGVSPNHFSVAIIPYTYTHTSLQDLQPGMEVNLEFDVLGKYVSRMLSLQRP